MKVTHGLPVLLAFGTYVLAQVKTEVPAIVPGAKPVTVEHIKVHGVALEGNLEGDDVDREVLVFLPPSYATAKTRRYPVVLCATRVLDRRQPVVAGDSRPANH